MPAKKDSSKRELIDTGKNKSYVRRDDKGQFKEVDDVGRSLSQDVKKPAKAKVPPGQGDRGDQPQAKSSAKAAPKTSAPTASKAPKASKAKKSK